MVGGLWGEETVLGLLRGVGGGREGGFVLWRYSRKACLGG